MRVRYWKLTETAQRLVSRNNESSTLQLNELLRLSECQFCQSTNWSNSQLAGRADSQAIVVFLGGAQLLALRLLSWNIQIFVLLFEQRLKERVKKRFVAN